MNSGYTTLHVQDVEKTVAFYESAFSLKRAFVHEGGYGEMDTGETKLAFASVELAPPPNILHTGNTRRFVTVGRMRKPRS